MFKRFALPLALAVVLMAATSPTAPTHKVTGVNWVSPPKPVKDDCFTYLDEISAGWVALNPFAFGEPGNPRLAHDLKWQWWGEKKEGTRKMAKLAKNEGLKVCIKPHIWVKGDGWPGDFTLDSEAKWRIWEKDYKDYVMGLLDVAIEENVEMFALGTEVRVAARERPNFWRHLIRTIREKYDGKLTYAANWDNYASVPFWDELDYIGVDCYFPLVDDPNPEVKDIVAAWKPYVAELEAFSKRFGKPILFTEYGYRSVPRTTWKQWEIEEHWNFDGESHEEAQLRAYEGIFQAFWQKEWCAGGFLWKWYDDHANAGGDNNTDYTPQNKAASATIKDWYSGKKN